MVPTDKNRRFSCSSNRVKGCWCGIGLFVGKAELLFCEIVRIGEMKKERFWVVLILLLSVVGTGQAEVRYFYCFLLSVLV